MLEKGQTGPLVVKSIVAGGVAGIAGKSIVAPLDRVKILLQTQKAEFTHCGVTSTLIYILKNEGIVGLFRGNFVQMVRIFPYGGIQFSMYEVIKRTLTKGDCHSSHLSKFIAGSLGGVCGVTATYPLDILRARLAFYSKDASGYKNLNKAIHTIYKEQGTKGFYRGWFPSVLAIIPQSGLSFCFFELLKSIFIWKLQIMRRKTNCVAESDCYKLSTTGRLISGGLAGAMAQSVSYPLDVVRRRMQMGDGTRFIAVLKDTYTNHGIRKGLFRGLSVNYVRTVPMNAVSFCVYETCKQVFGISTSLKTKQSQK